MSNNKWAQTLRIMNLVSGCALSQNSSDFKEPLSKTQKQESQANESGDLYAPVPEPELSHN